MTAQARQLAGHIARDRLAAIHDVVDGLAGDAQFFGQLVLIELQFRE